MTSTKGGRRSKSEGLTQNLTRKVSRADKVALKTLELEEARLKKARKEVTGEDPEEATPDDKASYQMLQDLRAAYKTGRGKQRLEILMEDDKEFKFLVKELIKVETAVIAAKIRRDGAGSGGGSGQAVFVVLKGLECEKPLVTAMEKNLPFDIGQVMSAINPEEGHDRYIAPTVDTGERPAEIVKILAGVENDTTTD